MTFSMRTLQFPTRWYRLAGPLAVSLLFLGSLLAEASPSATAAFADNGQRLNVLASWGVVLGDFDGIGLQGGTRVRQGRAAEIWLNETESVTGGGMSQNKRLTLAWEISDQLRSPESAAYDPKRNVLYVSNFRNDGHEFLSRIGMDGKILELEWVAGLDRPTGVRIHNDRLYVVERPGVAEIDIDATKITRRFPIADAGFVNDLAFDDAGALYVTDSRKGSVYRIADDGTTEVWLAEGSLPGVNGILAVGPRLLVGVTGDASIKSVDLATKAMTTIVKLDEGSVMDGLVPDGYGGYLISDYSGRVFRVQLGGEPELILDISASGGKTADIEYVPDPGLLIAPSLGESRLRAFRYVPGAE